jgi:hypothetical protein
MKSQYKLFGLMLLALILQHTSPVLAADLSGQWEMVLSDGQVYSRLDLSQNNDQVTGTATYKKGSARVSGRISGNEALLNIIFDNADVLTEWCDRKIAEQVVGLTSAWKITLNAGTTQWHGPFQGFGLEWNSSQQVTARYDANTPGVERRYPPTERILRRIGSISDGGGSPLTTERILIEAEDEIESSIRPLSERPAPNTKEIHPPWRPPYSGSGVWYLAAAGEFLKYRFNVQKEGLHHMWVRDYVDRFQPKGVRRIIVEFDGRPYGVFSEVDLPATGDKGAFGWHRIGNGVNLTIGTHTMKITKEATTAGAAILDAFYLTTDPNDRPAEK